MKRQVIMRSRERQREGVRETERQKKKRYLATNMMSKEKSLVAVHLAEMSP
jgi:hypothetical protein